VKEIELHGKYGRGLCALVDDEDYELVKDISWHGKINKWKNGNTWIYARGALKLPDGKFKLVYMHRLIVDAPSNVFVDHINGNTLDNRRENLRFCTFTQNRYNSKPDSGSKSEYKGVYWCAKSNKWEARITVNGQVKSYGRYDDKVIAAHVYDGAAITHFGEFARLNFSSPEDIALSLQLFEQYQPRKKSSIYRGVSWEERLNKWKSEIQINYRRIVLGYFEDEVEAAIAYDRAAIIYHGDRARLNFPENMLLYQYEVGSSNVSL
jgi:hypothetical protein